VQLLLACAELRQCLGVGQPCRSEELLAKFPALAARDDLAIDLVLAEWTLLRSRGEEASPEAWAARFPQLAERLRQRLRVAGAATLPLGVDSSTVTKAEESAEVQRPRRAFGRYELLDELGHGGMGRVFKARDTVLGRLVALKVLRAGIAAHPEELYRFHREAQAIARLQHRHIVPVYDLGEHDGQPYLTMAYVPGGTLAEHRERFTGDVRAAVSLVEKVARAVQAAHEQGIVHRDLKPGNVLLDEAGEPLVSDFGLAKLLGGGDEVTHTGQILGTPAYMAPEQAAGQGHEVTPASDVWALGVMLYELFTGRRPFEGKGVELTRQVQFEEPPRPRSLLPAVDRALETIALKCMEKDPTRRYLAAGGLADDLARWQRGEQVVARPRGWAARAGRVLRGPGRLAAVLGVLAAAALVLFAALRPRDPDFPLRQEEQAFARGRPVSLIGEQGPPAWSRWPLNEAGVIQSPEPDAAFTLSTVRVSLLELFPAPSGAYRFAAEVRHNEYENGGEVGLAFGCNSQQTHNGREECYCTLQFSDLEANYSDAPPRRQSHVALCIWRQRPGEHRWHAIRQYLFDPAGLDQTVPRPWRRLAVDFRPESLTCYWEDKEVFRLPATELQAAFSTLKQVPGLVDDCPELRPEFIPRQGVGLFLSHGAASFRSVEIEPRP
jgi:hypothetical protein